MGFNSAFKGLSVMFIYTKKNHVFLAVNKYQKDQSDKGASGDSHIYCENHECQTTLLIGHKVGLLDC